MSPPSIFAQRGNTKRIAVSTATMSRAVKMSEATNFPQANNYIITNFGPNWAYVGYGPDSDTAIDNAVVPTAGDTTGKFCFVVPPGQRSIEAKSGVYFAAITEKGTADLLLTPGHGSVDGFGTGDADTQSAANATLSSLLTHFLVAQKEVLDEILTELHVHTLFLQQGFVVKENPENIRGDIVREREAVAR